MNLTLSRKKHLKCSYHDQTGFPLYVVKTSKAKLFKSSVTKVVLLSPEDFSGIPYNEINVKEAKGKKLGEIKWHSIRSTRLIIGGKELKIRNFIKENKMSDEDRALGKGRGYKFKGKDGAKYQWVFSDFPESNLVLHPKENPGHILARYQAQQIVNPSYPSGYLVTLTLEITPAAQHMLELTFLTFLVVKSLRNEEVRKIYSSGGHNKYSGNNGYGGYGGHGGHGGHGGSVVIMDFSSGSESDGEYDDEDDSGSSSEDAGEGEINDEAGGREDYGDSSEEDDNGGGGEGDGGGEDDGGGGGEDYGGGGDDGGGGGNEDYSGE